MAERLQNAGEQGFENQEALSQEREKQRAEIERSLERNVEHRNDNVEQLKDSAEKAAEREKPVEKAAPLEVKRDTRAQRKAKQKASYKKTMKEAQAHMSAPERAFSKVIHNKAVEKTSEVVGGTVARPNAVLAGSLTAFLFTLGIYLLTRRLGYPLSGAETIAAFIVGWVVGLLFDYLRVMITGKKA